MSKFVASENSSARSIIVVLGMHRSGTSAITRGLEAIDVDLGNNFVPNNWDNERGFWEDSEIVEFNENLQNKLGYFWYGSTVVDAINWDNPIFIEAKEQAKILLEKRINQNDIYGFKDPRTAVLIEFWLKVFHELGLLPHFVIALRNPLEVADSLFKRNDLPKEKSLLLWAASIFHSITFTKNESRIIIGYDEILRSPLQQLSRISSVFKLPPVNEGSESVVQYCNEYLTNDLRHSNHQDADLYNETSVLPVVSDIYFLLKKVANDEISMGDIDFNYEWDSLCKRYKEIIPLLRYVNLIENKKDILEMAHHEKRLELVACSAELKSALDAIDKIKATLSWKVTKPLRVFIK